MELWNEYEGRTIDGAFPLTKLLRPEGRSAFFSTSNGTGVPTVIRLIESHFDDEEILARWREVEQLDHEHLVKLKTFGQVELDGTSLVYAVMEPVEANLGEILEERRLTVIETKQVATGVLSALEALHAHGFIHEHVEPDNVLAVGETIKLRSDCVREAPEGEEGRKLMRRDARDLAALLLRALTRERTLESAARERPLQAPFEQIVTKGMSGEWGLAEMRGALTPVVAAPVVPAARPAAAVPVREVPVARPVEITERVAPLTSDRIRVPVAAESRGVGIRKVLFGVGAVLVLLVVWVFMHGRSASSGSVPQEVAAPAAGESAATPTAAVSAPVAPNRSAAQSERAAVSKRGVWRVVAYTYNRQEQAHKKEETIAQEHPDLRPEVFTPNGRAPYLVTVGGQMSKDDAFALARRARGEGLPHDIYAQNYIAR